MDDMDSFSRTVKLIGDEALQKLRFSKVAVFGIGGVGSFAVEALARAGVGEFTLVDGDCIARSNINRQIHSLMSTLGLPKVEVMKTRILDINPEAKVQAIFKYYPCEIDWAFDYVIDAVDTVAAKVDIIIKSKENGFPVISSMGAGNKLFPELFRIADISKTKVCPLARVMRRELGKRGIKGVKVVYSEEIPVETDRQEANSPDEFDETGAVYPAGAGESGCAASDQPGNYRRSYPGSISFVPAAAGLILAGEVIRDIIKF